MKKNQIVIIVAICISIAMSILNICVKEPMSWLDEETHYTRSLELARGYLMYAKDGDMSQVGGYISDGENAFIDWTYGLIPRENDHIDFGWWSKYTDVDYGSESIYRAATNTIPYVPIVYLPYVLVALFTRIFAIKPVYEFLLMRFAGMMCSYTIYLLAIKKSSKAKLPLAFMLLNPMVFCTFSAITADSYLIVVTALYLSELFELFIDIKDKKTISTKRIVEIICVMALTVCSKMPNFIMIGLLLPVIYLMVKNKYDKKKVISLSLAVVAGAIFTISWFILVKDVNTGAFWYRNVDTYAQLGYIAQNIPRFIKTLVLAIIYFPFGTMQLGYMISSYVEIPGLVSMLFYIGLYMATRYGSSSKKLADKELKENRLFNIWANVLNFSYMVLIFVMLYLQFTNIGDNIIEGVQPRYFIPIILFYLYMFTYNFERRATNKIIIGLTSLMPSLAYLFIVVYGLAM